MLPQEAQMPIVAASVHDRMDTVRSVAIDKAIKAAQAQAQIQGLESQVIPPPLRVHTLHMSKCTTMPLGLPSRGEAHLACTPWLQIWGVPAHLHSLSSVSHHGVGGDGHHSIACPDLGEHMM